MGYLATLFSDTELDAKFQRNFDPAICKLSRFEVSCVYTSDCRSTFMTRIFFSFIFPNILEGKSMVNDKVRPPLWSSGLSFWLQIQRSRVRFPALPDFLSSSGSGTESTQPRDVN